MTDFDLSMITGNEPPLETEQEVVSEEQHHGCLEGLPPTEDLPATDLQLILQELKSINNKMESVETAATLRPNDFVRRYQEAFDKACEHEANPPDDPEIGPSAPSQPWVVDRDGVKIHPPGTLDHKTECALQENAAKERLDATGPKPWHAPAAVQVTKVTAHTTGRSLSEADLTCFCGRRVGCGRTSSEGSGWEACLCGRTWSWLPEGKTPILAEDQSSQLIVDDPEVVKTFRETHPGESVGRVFSSLLADWKSYKHWHEKTCTLLGPEAGRTPSMIYATVECLVEKRQGLQDPSNFMTAEGDRFIIQYTPCEDTIVRLAIYRGAHGRNCFETVSCFVEFADVEAMMPFSKPVKVDRSE